MKTVIPREFSIIEKYFSKKPNEKNILGVGDDCSAIPIHLKKNLLTTTDHMVEGIHFLMDKMSPWQLGWKSLAVSLSDIAAMGGRPIGAFLNIAVPKECSPQFFEEFSRGFYSLANEFNVPLLGGDTTSSPGPLFVGTTVLGEVGELKMKTRCGAQEGDEVVVCGPMGDSHIGLNLILEKISGFEESSYFLEKHLQPRPLVEEGLWLGEQKNVHAMMDLSDGLASDLGHICRSSQLGADIFTEKILASEKGGSVIEQFSLDRNSIVLEGGEDYGLLLAVSSNEFPQLKANFEDKFPMKLVSIGQFKNGSDIRYLNEGIQIKDPSGFQHF